jgi:hypothetical protein
MTFEKKKTVHVDVVNVDLFSVPESEVEMIICEHLAAMEEHK